MEDILLMCGVKNSFTVCTNYISVILLRSTMHIVNLACAAISRHYIAVS